MRKFGVTDIQGSQYLDISINRQFMEYRGERWQITKGLMSGLKLTSVVGSVANLYYCDAFKILESIAWNETDVVAGDDASLTVGSIIDTMKIVDRFKANGLIISHTKNRLGYVN